MYWLFFSYEIIVNLCNDTHATKPRSAYRRRNIRVDLLPISAACNAETTHPSTTPPK